MPALERAFLAEQAVDRAAKSRAAVSRRQIEGFRHPGGPLPGHPGYVREAFVYLGLPSDGCAGLQHFVQRLPRAGRLRTGDYPGDARTGDRKLIALDDLLVEDDPRMRSNVCVRIKGTFPSRAALLAAVARCGAPVPNHAPNFTDAAGLHDPHLIWRVLEPVSTGEKSSKKAIRRFARIEAGFTKMLLPIGADPAGIGSLVMRNPCCPYWSDGALAVEPYTLVPDKRPGAGGYIALLPFLDRAAARMRPPPLAPEDRRVRLSEAGRKGGKASSAARGAATLGAVVDAIRRLAVAGRRPTQAAVAAEIGRSERTVRWHWHAALALAEKPASKPPQDRRKDITSAPQARVVGAIPEIHRGPTPPDPHPGVRAGGGDTLWSFGGGRPGPRRTFPHPPPANAARRAPNPFLPSAAAGGAGGAATQSPGGARASPRAMTRRRPPPAGPP
jgi:hypothetical protein